MAYSEPFRIKTIEKIYQSTEDERQKWITECHFNMFCLKSHQVSEINNPNIQPTTLNFYNFRKKDQSFRLKSSKKEMNFYKMLKMLHGIKVTFNDFLLEFQVNAAHCITK